MDYRSMRDMNFNSSMGRLYYKFNEGSEGLALILLHGFAASSLSWSRLIRCIPDETCVVAVDLLGHGNSEAPEMEYTASNQATAIRELAESTGKKTIMFGHSYGAWLASLLAMDSVPEKLIIEDAAGLEAFDKERLSSNPEYLEDLVRQALITNPNERVVRSSVYSRREDDKLTCEKLTRINVPTLIIWGANDATVPARFAQTFNSCIKGSSLLVMDNVRHTPHYTNPNAVAEKVLGFIKQ